MHADLRVGQAAWGCGAYASEFVFTPPSVVFVRVRICSATYRDGSAKLTVNTTKVAVVTTTSTQTRVIITKMTMRMNLLSIFLKTYSNQHRYAATVSCQPTACIYQTK